MIHHLLTTKIQVPPLPANVIPRARLFSALDRGLEPNLRVTLISAPAGYGKTTLLNSWIRERDLTAAWLSISEGDNDPARFGDYLLAALKAANLVSDLPSHGGSTQSDDDFQRDILIPVINDLSQRASQWVFVLDDYHLIHETSVHSQIDFLLRNLPPNAHLYIATRADPPLPIARMRGRGQFNEVRMRELQFSSEETLDLFKLLLETELSEEAIQALHRRTEGWVSGLQMAAASLRKQGDSQRFIQQFSGSHRHVMDYLMDEVFRREPEELQDFLLDTSIFERLCASLCDATRPFSKSDHQPAGETLERLENDNLFLMPLDERREWYRYHRLFRDILQRRLETQRAEDIPILHRRASQWFEDHGLIDEAVKHALRCDDPDFAGDMVERNAQQILLRSETVTFLRWVQRLPPNQMINRARLRIYKAWALLLQGAPLTMVQTELSAGGEELSPPGGAESLEAFICLSQGQVKRGLRLAEEALALLPMEESFLRDFAQVCAVGAKLSLQESDEGHHRLGETERLARGTKNRTAAVMMLCELAELRLKQLQLDAAERLYGQALGIGSAEDGSRLPIAGRALIGLGDIAFERCELDSAESLLREGIDLVARWSLIATMDGHFSLAQIHDLRGADGELRRTLEILDDLSYRFDASEFDDIIVMLLKARVNIRRGDLDGIHEFVTQRGLLHAPAQKPPGYHQEYMRPKIYKYEIPVLARWHLAEGRTELARAVADELAQMAEESNRPFLLIEAEILRARIHQGTGNQGEALRALEQALRLARPARCRRIFVSEGPDLRSLLKAGREKWDDPELMAFVDDLIERMRVPPKTSQAQRDLPEPLTPRELEVIALLPSGMKASELADELVISVNTLRSHLKNIYAKLGVHSRHEAVVKASQLDLI